MNTCNNCNKCNSCGDPCNSCGKCQQAPYDCNFSISAVPFDPTTWNVVFCGKMHKVKIPPFAETDTNLSINYGQKTLNYQAEKHTDILTGEQLGSIIDLGDLRDTKVDYDTEALCYELVYHKYGECGEGCQSLEDSWYTFSIDNEGALGTQIRYVRGANRYGCPYFLDVPSDTSQFWFEGWRGDTKENGYYQPRYVDQLPMNEQGDYYVMSVDPVTMEPVYGLLPWHCVIQNIMGSTGVEVSGVWNGTGTTGFQGHFDPLEGNFKIEWDDWNDTSDTQHAGHGEVIGKVNWEANFDTATGSFKYVFHSVYFEKMTWVPDQGITQPTAPTMYLWAISMPSGTETQIIPGVTFGKSKVDYLIDQTIQSNQTIYVDPGTTVGPFDFVRIFVDWVGDDNGRLGIQFKSNASGWIPC